MNNIEFVKIWDSRDYVLEEPASLSLAELGLLDNIVKKLPILNIFHDQEQMFGSLDDLKY